MEKASGHHGVVLLDQPFGSAGQRGHRVASSERNQGADVLHLHPPATPRTRPLEQDKGKCAGGALQMLRTTVVDVYGKGEYARQLYVQFTFTVTLSLCMNRR